MSPHLIFHIRVSLMALAYQQVRCTKYLYFCGGNIFFLKGEAININLSCYNIHKTSLLRICRVKILVVKLIWC